MSSQKQLQHGDVLLLKLDMVPAGATKVDTSDRLVLAEGEATGHAHTVSPPNAAMLFEFNERRYLQVLREAKLRHEEHHEIKLPRGIYEIGRVREVDPFESEIRTVRD